MQKQLFTRKEIETDLKNVNKNNMLGSFLLTIYTGACTLICWLVCDMENNKSVILWILFSVIFLMFFTLFCALIYFIYRYNQPHKYEIVSDKFEYCYSKGSFKNGLLFFSFKHYGSYCLRFESPWKYYKWSDTCQMSRTEISKCTSQGDEYYLIIIKNKIAYIYSKRVFEFKETNPR